MISLYQQPARGVPLKTSLYNQGCYTSFEIKFQLQACPGIHRSAFNYTPLYASLFISLLGLVKP